MGYLFNSTFWAQLNRHEKALKKQLAKTKDWSEALTDLAKTLTIYPLHFLPTFSRVHHIGTLSSLGNGKRPEIPKAPWERVKMKLGRSCDILQDDFLKCFSNFTIKPAFRQVFGEPCLLLPTIRPSGPRCHVLAEDFGRLENGWRPQDRYSVKCLIDDGIPCNPKI